VVHGDEPGRLQQVQPAGEKLLTLFDSNTRPPSGTWSKLVNFFE
jgi:hypothetical protein